MSQQAFDTWGLVELMGHQRLAGRITTETIAGASFFRIDVPETKASAAFTRWVSAQSVYAINPSTEETALAVAAKIQSVPALPFDARQFVNQHTRAPRELGSPDGADDFDDDDSNDDDDESWRGI